LGNWYLLDFWPFPSTYLSASGQDLKSENTDYKTFSYTWKAHEVLGWMLGWAVNPSDIVLGERERTREKTSKCFYSYYNISWKQINTTSEIIQAINSNNLIEKKLFFFTSGHNLFQTSNPSIMSIFLLILQSYSLSLYIYINIDKNLIDLSVKSSSLSPHPLWFHPYPFFQWYSQSREVLLNLSMKCWNLAFNAQGWRVIIVVVQVRAVKIFVAAVEVLRKKGRGYETQFTTKIGGKKHYCTLGPSYFIL